MAKYKKRMKLRKRSIMLCLLSVIVIVFTTFSIGKYWFEIYDKYQEKKELER